MFNCNREKFVKICYNTTCHRENYANYKEAEKLLKRELSIVQPVSLRRETTIKLLFSYNYGRAEKGKMEAITEILVNLHLTWKCKENTRRQPRVLSVYRLIVTLKPIVTDKNRTACGLRKNDKQQNATEKYLKVK